MTDLSLVSAGRISDLITADFPIDPVWIGPGILPKRTKMIFGGAAGIGKSFFLLSLARALALGERPFDCPEFTVDRPVRVLLVEHELKPYGLQKRVKPVFADVDLTKINDTFFYVSGEPAIQFSSAEGISALSRIVREVEPEVLILDPVGKMHYYDENSNTDIAKLMYQIDLLLREGADRGMSVVFSHHFAKQPGMTPGDASVRDPLDPYWFRGAAKWKDDPDVRVTMQEGSQLRTPHKAWSVTCRFLTRQDEGHDDMVFHVNEFADQRVRYVRSLKKKTIAGLGGAPVIPPSSPVPNDPHHQGPQAPINAPSTSATNKPFASAGIKKY